MKLVVQKKSLLVCELKVDEQTDEMTVTLIIYVISPIFTTWIYIRIDQL